MRELTYRKGFIKLWRLGDLNFRKQKAHKGNAPKTKGIWAFPYPYYEEFYAFHKYVKAMPKDVRESDSEEVRDKWVDDVGKKTVKMTEFWYQGEIYTHLFDSSFSVLEWNRVSTDELYRLIKQVRGNDNIEWFDGKKYHSWTSPYYLEVFIPQGRGTIRSGKLP